MTEIKLRPECTDTDIQLEEAIAQIVMEAVRLAHNYTEPSASAQAEVTFLVDTERIRELFKQQQRKKRWCRFSGPGRGDCEHFVGLPTVLDETTTDEYGVPRGWCDYCWAVEQLKQRIPIAEVREMLEEMARRFIGPKHNFVRHVDTVLEEHGYEVRDES